MTRARPDLFPDAQIKSRAAGIGRKQTVRLCPLPRSTPNSQIATCNGEPLRQDISAAFRNSTAPDTGIEAAYWESVFPVRTAPAFARFFCAALLALLLGLRLLGATGYMPGVEHGAMTIVVCPDADVNAPLAIDVGHHHRGHSEHKHGGLCPYASASSLGALGSQFGVFLAVLIFAVAVLLGHALTIRKHNRLRERPPSRGPPLPA
jgi:hypothetical protein